MLRLFINTAGSIDSLTLLEKKNVLAHREWLSDYNETEKLLPELKKLLLKVKRNLSDLSEIIVVRGPGPFSALRIGVTVANVLAYSQKIPLLSIASETLWLKRRPLDQGENPSSQNQKTIDQVLLLHAGGTYVALCSTKKKEILLLENALKKFSHKKSILFFGDLTEKEQDIFDRMKAPGWKFTSTDSLTPMAKTLATLALSDLRAENNELGVTPEYWKPPNITKAKP